jgi:hypothetical protein
VISTLQAEAGGSQVQGQLGLCIEKLKKKKYKLSFVNPEIFKISTMDFLKDESALGFLVLDVDRSQDEVCGCLHL